MNLSISDVYLHIGIGTLLFVWIPLCLLSLLSDSSDAVKKNVLSEQRLANLCTQLENIHKQLLKKVNRNEK